MASDAEVEAAQRAYLEKTGETVCKIGMRAALDAAAKAAWRPIEEAPRDGTAVLVMRNIWPGTATGWATECCGHNTYVAEFWREEGWICYTDSIHEPRCPIEPTHFRPLPPPPETDR